MTYAPRVHFRVLIWDVMFVFFEAFLFSYCLLIPVLLSNSCQDMCKKKLYNTDQVFPDEFVRTFNESFFKKPYISVFSTVNFVALFGINTKATRKPSFVVYIIKYIILTVTAAVPRSGSNTINKSHTL